MQTIDQPARRIDDAERPLWIGQTPGAWGDVVRTIDPNEAHDAAAMIAAAGLDWRVEQHPLEAVIGREYHSACTRRRRDRSVLGCDSIRSTRALEHRRVQLPKNSTNSLANGFGGRQRSQRGRRRRSR